MGAGHGERRCEFVELTHGSTIRPRLRVSQNSIDTPMERDQGARVGPANYFLQVLHPFDAVRRCTPTAKRSGGLSRYYTNLELDNTTTEDVEGQCFGTPAEACFEAAKSIREVTRDWAHIVGRHVIIAHVFDSEKTQTYLACLTFECAMVS